MPGPGARPELASPDELAEVKAICPGAVYVSEGGSEFVHLPTLKIPVGDRLETRDALLSLNPHTGYVSRLYLSAPIAGRGQNWTSHAVLGRTWHTPSWNNVPAGRPIEMLPQHLKVYR
jgi:hypothetical protein